MPQTQISMNNLRFKNNNYKFWKNNISVAETIFMTKVFLKFNKILRIHMRKIHLMPAHGQSQ